MTQSADRLTEPCVNAWVESRGRGSRGLGGAVVIGASSVWRVFKEYGPANVLPLALRVGSSQADPPSLVGVPASTTGADMSEASAQPVLERGGDRPAAPAKARPRRPPCLDFDGVGAVEIVGKLA
jgi:hypothetical protein